MFHVPKRASEVLSTALPDGCSGGGSKSGARTGAGTGARARRQQKRERPISSMAPEPRELPTHGCKLSEVLRSRGSLRQGHIVERGLRGMRQHLKGHLSHLMSTQAQPPNLDKAFLLAGLPPGLFLSEDFQNEKDTCRSS